jgi:hypothetical protein
MFTDMVEVILCVDIQRGHAGRSRRVEFDCAGHSALRECDDRVFDRLRHG